MKELPTDTLRSSNYDGGILIRSMTAECWKIFFAFFLENCRKIRRYYELLSDNSQKFY